MKKQAPSYETEELRAFAEVLRGRRTIELFLQTPVPEKLILEAIETAVLERSVAYERLLTGASITHHLHDHLDRLLGTSGVTIRANDREHFNHLTVTEYECLMFLPGVEEDHFYGLRFKGHTHSRRFGNYFSTVFGACDKVRDPDELSALCECRD